MEDGNRRWLRLPYPAYNAGNGEMFTAADDDAAHELAVGLGRYPDRGGYVALFDDTESGWSFLGWPRVPWSTYYTADGGDVAGARSVSRPSQRSSLS